MTKLLVIELLIIMGCTAQPFPVIKDNPGEARTRAVAKNARTAQQVAPAGGELSLVSVFPAIGSTLTEGSVIQATFEYRIVNLKTSARYAIAPFFADKAGKNRSFSARKDLTAALPLKATTGRVELQYPIRAEWNDDKMARPPVVWFDLIEQDSNLAVRVVAEIGPFQYE